MASPFQSYEQWPRKWSSLPPILISEWPRKRFALPARGVVSPGNGFCYPSSTPPVFLGEQWSWKRILPFPHVSSMRVDPGNGYVPSSSFVRCRFPLAHVRRAAMMCARRVCATRFFGFLQVATSDPMNIPDRQRKQGFGHNVLCIL